MNPGNLVGSSAQNEVFRAFFVANAMPRSPVHVDASCYVADNPTMIF
jgi:hypothetical protein